MFSYKNGRNQNISIGSNILPNFGLIFAADKSNVLIEAENAVLLNVFSFIVHFRAGLHFIRGKNDSGISTLLSRKLS